MKGRGLQRHVAPVVDLPPAREEPAFLRGSQKARGRRVRRHTLGRTILLLEITGGVLVGLLVLWACYSRAMAHERLRVARVEVKGSRFLSEKDVRELLGPAVGESILALDIGELKTRLRTSPWVADARVSRTLPDTLKVEIEERAPLALAEVERLYLMDGDGVLIDMYGPRTASFDLPIVRGLGKVDLETRRDWASRAGALLRDLGELAAEISEVEMEPSGDLRVVLRRGGEVLRLGRPPYRERLLTFLRLRKELLARYPDAESFDVRFRQRIFVKHATPPAASARGTGEQETSAPGTAPSARPGPIGERPQVPEPEHPVTPSEGMSSGAGAPNVATE
jgi:cell division protein FtsQ